MKVALKSLVTDRYKAKFLQVPNTCSFFQTYEFRTLWELTFVELSVSFPEYRKHELMCLSASISESTFVVVVVTFFFFLKLKSLMRPPKSVRDRQDQMKKKIPTTKPSKHNANQHVAGKTTGSTEPSGSNLPPDPALKEWKQVSETKDTRIPNPSGKSSAGVLFRQFVRESEGAAS